MNTENAVEPKNLSSAPKTDQAPRDKKPSADAIDEKMHDALLEISQSEIIPSESDSSEKGSNPFAIFALIAVIAGIGVALFYATRNDAPAPATEPSHTREIAQLEPEPAPPKPKAVTHPSTPKESKKVEPKKVEPKKAESKKPEPEAQQPVLREAQQPVPDEVQQPVAEITTPDDFDKLKSVENEALRDQVAAEERHQRGDYANALARYQKAQSGFEYLLPQYKQIAGRENDATTAIRINLASIYNAKGDIYRNQKKYPEALNWLNKALEIRKNLQGENHPETAKIYNNIALVYAAQGQYAKALEWYEKDLAISENTLGADHPDTAMTYSNIGIAHYHLGNRDNALEWFKKALTIQEKNQVDKNPNAAMTYNNIAEIYRVQGDYATALPEYLKAYRILQNTVGEQNPTTKTVKLNLSRAYAKSDNARPFDEWLAESLR